jgi:hypothetical protein
MAGVTGAYNQVADGGKYTYQYDKDGNRTRRTLKSTVEYETYAYDYRQRLGCVTKKTSANASSKDSEEIGEISARRSMPNRRGLLRRFPNVRLTEHGIDRCCKSDSCYTT